jgi:hypothetical protein
MPLEFQIYDWLEDHEVESDESSDEESSEDNKDKNYSYIIHTFW